jgi:hydroxymethylpyrimidine/phosphomethylpyrimidine kinase
VASKPVALTIAGSDPSGGAGIQADLKTFHQFGVYGEAVITLITVQNTVGVEAVEVLPAGLVTRQILAVIQDIPPAAAKTGALGTREVIEAVSEAASDFAFPLVVDPVIVSKHGAPLMDATGIEALKSCLLPHTFLLMPNLHEAAALTRLEVTDVVGMRHAAEALAAMGPKSVLVKGGHLDGEATDILLHNGEWFQFTLTRLKTQHTHGTGCTYSAAITAGLAQSLDLPTAVRRAKRYVHSAIETNPGLGSGHGPVNHHASPF